MDRTLSKRYLSAAAVFLIIVSLIVVFASACGRGTAPGQNSAGDAQEQNSAGDAQEQNSAGDAQEQNSAGDASQQNSAGDLAKDSKDAEAYGTEKNAKASEPRKKAASFNFKKKTVMLNSGYEMPVIGLGTWTLTDDEAENSVYHALKSGMRLIDTARYYDNEVGVGKGLRRAIDEGIVKREDVFITSKIFGGDHKRAKGIIDEALADLNVDYIDLMLIHQPGADDEGVYKAMEDAVKDGRLRSIGISNYYTKEQVDEVLSFATITPAVIQNENHIFYQGTKLQKYVSQYGIVIESWYPFGGRGHTSEHFDNDVISELATKYRKSSAQIILRWHLQSGFIAIPGSSNPDHIAENYDIFDFELSHKDMKRIKALDRQARYESW